jgi:hypothetical protein
MGLKSNVGLFVFSFWQDKDGPHVMGRWEFCLKNLFDLIQDKQIVQSKEWKKNLFIYGSHLITYF